MTWFRAPALMTLPVVVLYVVVLPVGLLLGAPESEAATTIALFVGGVAGLAAWLWTLREIRKTPEGGSLRRHQSVAPPDALGGGDQAIGSPPFEPL